ncbi:MAG: hypothetical protein FJ102_07425 [Deltaproteobacteria bacterium]|nr:hypothetical protein [Deltaproteobacteria bacterium]
MSHDPRRPQVPPAPPPASLPNFKLLKRQAPTPPPTTPPPADSVDTPPSLPEKARVEPEWEEDTTEPEWRPLQHRWLDSLRAVAAWLWQAVRVRLDSRYARSEGRAAAVAHRQVRAAYPDGPPFALCQGVEIAPGLSAERVRALLYERLEREPDFNAVHVRVTERADALPFVSSSFSILEPGHYELRIAMPDAEHAEVERIDRERLDIRLGREDQRLDRVMNTAVIDASHDWVPRNLADFEWSPRVDTVVLTVPVETQDKVAAVLNRGRDKVMCEAGSTTALREGDRVDFKQVNGPGVLSVKFTRSKETPS